MKSMIRHWTLAMALVAMPACADEQPSPPTQLPQALQGTWATADSVFEGDHFWGGTVLYLLPGGQAALVGAPLPVRNCNGQRCAPIIGLPGQASHDEMSHRLSLVLSDGQKSLRVEFAHLVDEDVLHGPGLPAGELRLQHRSPGVPEALSMQFQAH